jgi:hypothetical protein
MLMTGCGDQQSQKSSKDERGIASDEKIKGTCVRFGQTRNFESEKRVSMLLEVGVPADLASGTLTLIEAAFRDTGGEANCYNILKPLLSKSQQTSSSDNTKTVKNITTVFVASCALTCHEKQQSFSADQQQVLPYFYAKTYPNASAFETAMRNLPGHASVLSTDDFNKGLPWLAKLLYP